MGDKFVKIKGILLDKDGTLIDFFSLWGEAACKVTERVIDEYHLGQLPQARGCLLDSLGIKDGLADPEGALAWKSYSMIADDVYCALENQMKKHSFSPCTKFCRENLEKTLVREFTEETCTKVTEFKTFTDLKKLMSALAEKGIKLGVATTDTLGAAKDCCQKLGIYDKISFWAADGAEYPLKPDAEIITAAARLWGITPAEIAMVGDTPNDLRFAKNGHAVGIAVLCGTGKRKDLERLADYTINSLDDLLPLLCRENYI